MRGSGTFQKIFEPSPQTEIPIKKGRNSILTSQRNDLLIDRYVYCCGLLRMRYDDALEKVGGELFLTQRTVQDILQSNLEAILIAKRNGATKKQLSAKWPFLVW
jgi:hypothetical protein